MRELIDDDILDAFAIVAPPGQVAAAISKRYGDLFTRLHLYLKASLRKDVELSIAEELRQPSR
jgi:hypothetical protein